jgi:general secretion pathway protein E
MRIFDPEVLVRNMAELGFSEQDEARWHSIAGSPTASSWSPARPVPARPPPCIRPSSSSPPRGERGTIEDPIEMVEPAFNQMQVHQAIDLGFAEGVRALMRQDPDIIMVGEIRDLETAEMAIQAALTGHLVLSTLHTNDAPSAVTRMLDLGVPAYLLNATLLGIMAQRLVRILCPHCKQPHPTPRRRPSGITW